jgi:hypothetical protein
MILYISKNKKKMGGPINEKRVGFPTIDPNQTKIIL